MSVNLSSLYAQQFATTVQLLLQQKGSKLRPYVMEGSHVGKQASPVDQIGKVEAQLVTTRFGQMGRVDAAVDRRWVFPSDYDLPQLIDSFDKLKMIVDPKSSYALNATYAFGRAIDNVLISAFFGTNKTGESAGTSTTFTAGNIVAVGFGAAASVGMTVAKLREGKRLLMGYEVDLDNDPISCAINANLHDDLLSEAQIISTDFNERPVLVDGRVTQFVGVNLVHCERLTNNGSSDRQAPMWAKSGFYLGVWQDMITDISQRKDLQALPWQIYAMASFGATRLEENKCISIVCDD